MIFAEYIVDGNQSLLTINFNSILMKHMNTSCDDYLNFFQSAHDFRRLTLFKSDTGYKIIRVCGEKKFYKINVRHPLYEIKDFKEHECTYYMKKNGTIRIFLKI